MELFYNQYSLGYGRFTFITLPLFRRFRKVGRNELCPCKSGKKYKNCHLNHKKKEWWLFRIIKKIISVLKTGEI
jgi:hypothetical protein